ncbi:MAG: hypothetical protein ABW185_13790 [Sedimenticola sp.]
MVLSNAERVARWRARQREDPAKHAAYRRKEKQRYEKKKERGIVKPVTELTHRELRSKRRGWRKSQQARRDRAKMIAEHIDKLGTPPTSPDQPAEVRRLRDETMKTLGRKKKKRDRAQAYRQIFKLKVALHSEIRLKEKYKKRCNRLASTMSTDNETGNQIMSNQTRKALLFYKAIIHNVRRRYRKCKSYKQRRYISSLICSYGLTTKYRLGRYARKTVGFSRRMMKKTTKRSPQLRCIRMKQKICAFLERDDNSRIKADKKATITRRGEKMQKRLLTDDMKHLHAKLLAEGQVTVSYSLFCRLKPFWIVKPTERDRETCLCKLHENLEMKLERAYSENIYNTQNMNELVKTITCSDRSKECMYRECGICKDKRVPRNEFDEGKQVTWNMWKNQRIEKVKKNPEGEAVTKTVSMTVKEEESGTLTTLADDIDKEMERGARHIFNIRHQYSALRQLRENLTDDDVVIHIDFSENYNCKYKTEIQSVHFGASQKQISLHTGVAYTKDEMYSFTTISDCLKHNPAAIWAHLDPVLDFVKSVKDVPVNTIHVISDGPTTQYRNKQNFHLFSTRIFEKGFRRGTWNFLEAAHGKGAADGIGAVIKRLGDKVVHTGRHDVTCAEDLMKGIKADTDVKLFLVQEADILELERTIPPKLAVLPNTMRIHQVLY